MDVIEMGSGTTRSFKIVRTKVMQELQPRQKSLDNFLPQKSYETELKTLFQKHLAQLNNRDTEQIRKHLDTIKTSLEKDLDRPLELNYGGSLAKNTYANGISDIDMLVILNATELAGKSPKYVMKYFKKRLINRLPESEITIGKLAVTVKFKSTGNEIQLLPALKTKDGYQISTENGKHWSNVIKPYKFAKKLIAVNKAQGSTVLPIIKMFKEFNSALSPNSRLKGYHIESLAIEAFKNYEGTKNTKDMLKHFVKFASNALKHQIDDVSGQSDYVDGYLGNLHSFKRRKVGLALKNLSDKIQRADDEGSIEKWKDIIGD